MADLLPEAAPLPLRAAMLMGQQMIDGACKMVLAASMRLGRVDEHDLHPINLVLPLVRSCLGLCLSSGVSLLQQQAAWHTALRASAIIAAFIAGEDSGRVLAEGSGSSSAAGEADLPQGMPELDESRRGAVAVAFQKSGGDRITTELEQKELDEPPPPLEPPPPPPEPPPPQSQLLPPPAANPKLKDQSPSTSTGAPAEEPKAAKAAGTKPKKVDGGKSKREGGGKTKRSSSPAKSARFEPAA